MSKGFAVILLACLFVRAISIEAGQTPSGIPKTTWDGVYTAEQAARGEAGYNANCSRCHGEDLGGPNGRPLKGDDFADHYREYSLDILLRTLRTMPPRAAVLRTPAFERISLTAMAMVAESCD